ncbi:HNH/ENDO VII family nuclease [Herbaspirillum lusitanum]|uniref:HNH/ENDO VII family nuclease n=1 Tax=Herbaspirillum lusitanum TaxID=213312 RepID=A0ABW9A9X8_9BURK
MSLEVFVSNAPEGLGRLAELSREMPEKSLDIKSLDRPLAREILPEARESRPPMSAETREKLEGKGFPSSVLDAIGSDAEAAIYDKAPLEGGQVNGKDALLRTDIDPDAKDDRGRTNVERMQKGLAPLDSKGEPLQLHHIGQENTAPLAELTRDEHCRNGNDSILHDKKRESTIDRMEFGDERAAHWQARAEQLINQKDAA